MKTNIQTEYIDSTSDKKENKIISGVKINNFKKALKP